MRTALDVIRRCIHDPLFDQARVIIGFVDRLHAAGIREQPLMALDFENDIAACDDRAGEFAIPQHRIDYILYEGLGIIWHKANRVDRVFGSTGDETVVADLHLMAAEREAAGREAAGREAAEREAAEHEVAEREAAEREAAEREAAEREATREVAGRGAALPRNHAHAIPPPPLTAEDRPNAFFSIPIRNPVVRNVAVAVQKAFCEREPRLNAALVPPSALHITLAVARLADASAEAMALGVLEAMAPRLMALVPPHEPLVLSGVRSFRDRVLYAVVEPHAGLHAFVLELRAALTAIGLGTGMQSALTAQHPLATAVWDRSNGPDDFVRAWSGDHEVFTAHMTLLKLPRALCRSMGAIKRDVWWGASSVAFGEVGVSGAALCWMGRQASSSSSRQVDASRSAFYYHVLGESRLGRLLTTDDRASAGNDGEEMKDGAALTTELHVFDFDGTVASTLGPREGKAVYEQLTGWRWPHTSWLDQPDSLRAPLPVRPGPALDALRASLQRQRHAGGACCDLRSIVLTGRSESVRQEVSAMLSANGVALPSDQLHFRPAGTAGAFKTATLRRLLGERYPNVTCVTVWEDDQATLDEYRALAIELHGTDSGGVHEHRAHTPVELRVVDATGLPSPDRRGLSGGACAPFLRERIAPAGRVDATATEMALILDCWRAALLGVLEGAALSTHPDGLATLVRPFGSQPLGRRARDLDVCLVAPLPPAAPAGSATAIPDAPDITPALLLERMKMALAACGVQATHLAADARTPRLAMRLFLSTGACDIDMVAAIVRPDGSAADAASAEALRGPARLAEMRTRLNLARVSEACACIVLDVIDALLRPYAVVGATFHGARTFHLLDLLVRAAECDNAARASAKVGVPCERQGEWEWDADELLMVALRFAASLTATQWAARLGPASVPVAFQARLATAFSSLHSRLASSRASDDCDSVLTVDGLWALAELPVGVGGPPPGFAVAKLIAQGSGSADSAPLAFALDHVLRARTGRILFDLLHSRREVVPLEAPFDSAEGALVLAVYDRPSAVQELDRLCVPLLAELRQMAATAAADATIALKWTRAAVARDGRDATRRPLADAPSNPALQRASTERIASACLLP